MEKEALLADIAKNHQELTATQMTNSSFCIPVAGTDPTFTMTWNHDTPQKVLLYVYGGKCEFSYGSNSGESNPTIFLDSQDGQDNYIAQTITFPAGQGMAVDLMTYISNPGPSGVTLVGVSW